ncbi:unnamed protein product [Symbiodinium necroappetens]|uniref:Uncharacterized protein n=1 Tax=Symbiodinium necroappetens TaxID=1628268 RepID=A0A812ML19_9DINO|nr:unnamed protein product [Symbiodinium necroappetens]CAE7856791.1 unnamed protein product [Symbiodinium microadriaticum]CAE7938538.1 unnamed protein product [Symbiodinium sp. KB8]
MARPLLQRCQILWFLLASQRLCVCGSSIATDQEGRSRLVRSVAVQPDADFELPLQLCNGTSVEECDPGMPEKLCNARYVCDAKSCSMCRRMENRCAKDARCRA